MRQRVARDGARAVAEVQNKNGRASVPSSRAVFVTACRSDTRPVKVPVQAHHVPLSLPTLSVLLKVSKASLLRLWLMVKDRGFFFRLASSSAFVYFVRFIILRVHIATYLQALVVTRS
jgi:hypothetical protein